MPAKRRTVDLVQIIRDNPGCVATIDNDCWWLLPAEPEGLSEEEWDDWRDKSELASSNDKLLPLGNGGYGSGGCYGGDILQALAVIVGIKVESV
jgi:hypothetical protein